MAAVLQTDYTKGSISSCGALLKICLYLCHPSASKKNLHEVWLSSLLQILK